MFLRIFMLAACTVLFFVQAEGAPFQCPTCSAQGENAERDCEASIEDVPCPEEVHPVCVLTVTTKSSPTKRMARYCASREFYDVMKARCGVRGTCRTVMCDTSGCKVQFHA
ncbi:uncharacterized protein LOC144638681 isoform X2 [Oculina patagonica]